VLGLLASFVGLAALTLAVSEIPDPWALGSPQVIGLLAGGLVLLVGFVVIERRVHHPLLDLRLFAKRNINGASVTVFVVSLSSERRSSSSPSTWSWCSATTRCRRGCWCSPRRPR
jgi:hypothetical protein